MKFYLELASQRDYVVVLVQPKTPWRWNPVELAARNKHKVDVDTLKRKVKMFGEVWGRGRERAWEIWEKVLIIYSFLYLSGCAEIGVRMLLCVCVCVSWLLFDRQ